MNGLASSDMVAPSYDLSWGPGGRVINLRIWGIFSPDEAASLNQQLTRWLDGSRKSSSFILAIDATGIATLTQFEQVRAVQRYMFHPSLKYIFVAADNKLVRLSFMVMFNTSPAYVRLFDNWPILETYVNQSLDSFP